VGKQEAMLSLASHMDYVSCCWQVLHFTRKPRKRIWI